MKDWLGRRAGLGHPEQLLDLPQVGVPGDHLACRHHGDGHVADIAFEADRRSGPRQGGIVEVRAGAFDLDEPCRLAGSFAFDDGAGAFFLLGRPAVVEQQAQASAITDQRPGQNQTRVAPLSSCPPDENISERAPIQISIIPRNSVATTRSKGLT